LNSVANIGFKDNFSKGVRYDATFETKAFGFDTKLCFKAPHIEGTVDLGAYRWTKIVSGKGNNIWLNPYFKFGFDQNLHYGDFSLGFLFNWNSKIFENHQITVG
jgi:hypothetical protein